MFWKWQKGQNSDSWGRWVMKQSLEQCLLHWHTTCRSPAHLGKHTGWSSHGLQQQLSDCGMHRSHWKASGNRTSGSLRLRWGLRICISNESPGMLILTIIQEIWAAPSDFLKQESNMVLYSSVCMYIFFFNLRLAADTRQEAITIAKVKDSKNLH